MTQTTRSPKMSAARLSVFTALCLAILKLLTGLFTGSLAVLTSAVDSLLDILMSGINLVAIGHAEQPADDQHPYGHGKFETLATLFQSVVIELSRSEIEGKTDRQRMVADLARILELDPAGVRRKVGDVSKRLPPGVQTPRVVDDFSFVYGFVLAMTGDGFDYAELEDYAKALKDDLSLVGGVSRVELWGQQPKVLYLDVSEAQLAELKITAEDILLWELA